MDKTTRVGELLGKGVPPLVALGFGVVSIVLGLFVVSLFGFVCLFVCLFVCSVGWLVGCLVSSLLVCLVVCLLACFDLLDLTCPTA